MLPSTRPFFWLFAASGFCSLVYEIVWLRLAMAQFGVTTPVLSIFLSLFMAGIGLGSWAAGRMSRAISGRPAAFDLRSYAVCEAVIAVGALAAPRLFSLGHGYGWLVVGVLPWTVAMGATIPLGLGAIGKMAGHQPRAFSYLYLANVIGAALGSLISALVMIELLGFRGTLGATAVVSVLIAAAALALSFVRSDKSRPERRQTATVKPNRFALSMMFALGCAGMGMEVVWTRQFSLFLGNDVYALGSILAIYLLATATGSAAYRTGVRLDSLDDAWGPLGAVALLPLLACDAFIIPVTGALWGEVRLLFGIVPVCMIMGYLTPALVDGASRGDAEAAGDAYAVNILGCIAGALLAGTLLRPLLGERSTLILAALPFLALSWRRAAKPAALAASVAAVALVLVTREPWTRWPEAFVRRDHAATTVAGKAPTGEKLLLVNGNTMTILTPITKMMAHLPLAMLPSAPKSAAVICFGMGTTFRSLTTWNIPATAVELIPSVPLFFEYFHPDAGRALASPGARIVVDDGRRFLERTDEFFDVITLDPPPPAEAPGNSLLYSREFYEIARRRLRPGGILQQWHMGGDPEVTSAMAQALAAVFPHVRAFPSTEGWGVHFLASLEPLPKRSAAELARRLPPAAKRDLVEWGPWPTPEKQFQVVLANEIPLSALIDGRPSTPLSDDRPINEYFLLRRLGLRR
ncbi:MAG: hypothetical protein SF051_04540 [Elusimicrobiota bacterium]|nr:hypothetical protein [Elusimicrobiota bacterium]